VSDYRFTTTNGRDFTYVPAAGERPVSSVTSIDGYVFTGGGYVAAVTFWLDLYGQPGYRSNPPVLSISVPIEVSGTVDG
jgi:hypothetical protein